MRIEAPPLPHTALDVAALLERANHEDRLLAELRDWLRAHPQELELRSVLRSLARAERPRTYLEVGTRRGWSLFQVLAEVPTCRATVVDSWIQDYARAPNPGEAWLREEIRQVVPDWHGFLQVYSEDSHQALPRLDRSERFDLVTLDGDHTAIGTWCDLWDVWPLVQTGGLLVVDDVQGPPEPDRAIGRELPAMPRHERMLDVVEAFLDEVGHDGTMTVFWPEGQAAVAVIRKGLA